MLKCDASNKQTDDESDSNEIEQSLNEGLQSISESPIKKEKTRQG
jgi:hypothetical protein